MRVAFAPALLVSACAATAPSTGLTPSPEGPAAAAGPQLLSIATQIGVYEPGLRELLEANLPQLAACIAFANDDRGVAVPVVDGPTVDDRVEVQVEVRGDRVEVRARAVLSDHSCVERLVAGWPLTAEQRRSLAPPQRLGDAPPLVFRYRYRPGAEARQRARQENAEGFARLCAGLAGVDRDGLLWAYDRVKATLPARVRAEFDGVARALVYAAPEDRGTIFAATFKELAPVLGASASCRALRGWTPVVDSELVEWEGLPADSSCTARVAQLEALGAKPKAGPGLPVPDFSAADGKPVTEGGLVVEDRMFRDEGEVAFRPEPAEVQRLAQAQAKEQARARPVVYLVTSGTQDAAVLVDATQRWSRGFEVRLLVSRSGPAPLVTAASAWPEVVKALQDDAQNLPASQQAERYALPFEGAGAFCAPVPGVMKALEHAAPADKLRLLATGLAESLKACGCPRAWAEVAWARVALMADVWDGGVTWLPLNLTQDAKARALKLRVGAFAIELVRQLDPAVPTRVEWER